MSSSQVVELCQILVESNLQLCESIKENSFDVQDLYSHLKWTAEKINKLSKIIKKMMKYMTLNQDERKSNELSIMTNNIIN